MDSPLCALRLRLRRGTNNTCQFAARDAPIGVHGPAALACTTEDAPASWHIAVAHARLSHILEAHLVGIALKQAAHRSSDVASQLTARDAEVVIGTAAALSGATVRARPTLAVTVAPATLAFVQQTSLTQATGYTVDAVLGQRHPRHEAEWAGCGMDVNIEQHEGRRRHP